jgi:hypothetical protein
MIAPPQVALAFLLSVGTAEGEGSQPARPDSALWLAIADAPAIAESSPFEAEDSDIRAGVAMYERLEYDRAVVALGRALTNPNLATADREKALEILGFAYTVLGDTVHAESAFSALLDLSPGHAVAASLSPRLRDAFEHARAMWSEGRHVVFALTSSLRDKELVVVMSSGDPERVGSVVAREEHGSSQPLYCKGRECRGSRPDGPFYVDVRDHMNAMLTTGGPFTPDQNQGIAWWVWGSLALAALGGGVALVFALRREEAPPGSLGRLQLP